MPLYTNYGGGLIQAYALQTVLKRMGHDVVTENRMIVMPKQSIVQRLKGIPLLRMFAGKSKYSVPKLEEQRIISQNTTNFIDKYINITEPVYYDSKCLLDKHVFEAFIVGSDQVWRPKYSSCLSNYFLDFTQGLPVKRIAYAASFGTDEWEFTREQTSECSRLLKQFNAVSVREASGVQMCKHYFDVDAEHLIDPTMLLEKEDYINIVNAENETCHQGNIMTYFLDKNQMKESISYELCKRLNGSLFSVAPEKRYCDVGPKGIDQCVFPSLASWLRGFMDADYIVTDSFHGVVFSIIFNKPFIAIANKERGLSRFISLMKMFELESRLIYSSDDLTDDIINQKIDFAKINTIKEREREKALLFLEKALMK